VGCTVGLGVGLGEAVSVGEDVSVGEAVSDGIRVIVAVITGDTTTSAVSVRIPELSIVVGTASVPVARPVFCSSRSPMPRMLG
jgi:hypothetical protein